MKKNFLYLFAALSVFAVAACGNDDETDAVTGVSLLPNAGVLAVNDTLQLLATVAPANAADQTVTWSSSHNNVATVNNGIITALAIGETTITVTTNDGGHTAQCVITVNAMGKVSFKTSRTWTVGGLTWSDAVMASGARGKETFDGGVYHGEYKVDCRQNTAEYGDLFSWKAVAEHGGHLCANGWRVPTVDDYIALDQSLGGSGENRSNDPETAAKYVDANTWGGQYGGFAYVNAIHNQGELMQYWTQSLYESAGGHLHGYTLYITAGGYYLGPQVASNGNQFGFMLRCVKNN